MPAFHIPRRVPLFNEKTGMVSDEWLFFFEQLNRLVAGLTFSNISGVISLAQLVAHASTHKSAGSDVILLDELGAPTDVTTLNSTTLAHGLLPKLSGNAAHRLNGQGNWV